MAHNERITITQEDHHTWRLRIKQLRETDKGCYMCQVNTNEMIKQVGCIDVQSKQKQKLIFFYNHLLNDTLEFAIYINAYEYYVVSLLA